MSRSPHIARFLPEGGVALDVLKKASAANYDISWGDGGGTPPGTSPVLSVEARGGFGEYDGIPQSEILLEEFTTTIQSYDATGNVIAKQRSNAVTTRRWKLWPDMLDYDDNDVAFRDFIYQGEVVPGATNNSTLEAPDCNVRFLAPDRRVVANGGLEIPLLVFGHHTPGGQQAAAVEIILTHGGTTLASQWATSMELMPEPGDNGAVWGYMLRPDITAIPDATEFNVDVVVYPVFGLAARSTADHGGDLESTIGPQHIGFRQLTYYKRQADPLIAHVSLSGDDGAGVVSTTDSVAEASPFATILGALSAIDDISGAIVRLQDGEHTLPSAAAGNHQINDYQLRVEPASGATASIHGTGSNQRLGKGGVIFDGTDIRVNSGVKWSPSGGIGPMHMVLRNLTYTGSSDRARLMDSRTLLWSIGVTWAGLADNALLRTDTERYALFRGCDGFVYGMDPTAIVSCYMDDISGGNTGAVIVGEDPVLAFNRLTNQTFERGQWSYGAYWPDEILRVSIVGNVVDSIGPTDFPWLRINADGGVKAVSKTIIKGNTLVSAAELSEIVGRWNAFYSAGVTAVHLRNTVSGNVLWGWAMKGAEHEQDGAIDGNDELNHGIGCPNNWHCRVMNTRSDHARYNGWGSSAPAPGAYADPGFEDHANHDYRPAAGSPLKDALDEPVVPFDYNGVPNPRSIGAYA